MAYSREELVQQLAAVTASQDDVRLPYHLIDDILNDVQRQFGAGAISGVVDEALEIVERNDIAAAHDTKEQNGRCLMAGPKYPMTVVVKGGRVAHCARRVSDDTLMVVTLCGKRGVPNPDSTANGWCKACLAKPNPQDQRSYGGV